MRPHAIGLLSAIGLAAGFGSASANWPHSRSDGLAILTATSAAPTA